MDGATVGAALPAFALALPLPAIVTGLLRAGPVAEPVADPAAEPTLTGALVPPPTMIGGAVLGARTGAVAWGYVADDDIAAALAKLDRVRALTWGLAA